MEPESITEVPAAASRGLYGLFGWRDASARGRTGMWEAEGDERRDEAVGGDDRAANSEEGSSCIVCGERKMIRLASCFWISIVHTRTGAVSLALARESPLRPPPEADVEAMASLGRAPRLHWAARGEGRAWRRAIQAGGQGEARKRGSLPGKG